MKDNSTQEVDKSTKTKKSRWDIASKNFKHLSYLGFFVLVYMIGMYFAGKAELSIIFPLTVAAIASLNFFIHKQYQARKHLAIWLTYISMSMIIIDLIYSEVYLATLLGVYFIYLGYMAQKEGVDTE